MLIFAAISLRKSRATRSDETVCTTLCKNVKIKIPMAIRMNSRTTLEITKFPFVYASIACEVICGTTRLRPFAKTVSNVSKSIQPQYGRRSETRLGVLFGVG